ncbi:MAG: DUF401 family protein [bacterium]
MLQYAPLAYQVVCLVAVFALMVWLMRRKVDVSWALVAGAVAVGVCFGIDWAAAPGGLGADLGGIALNLGRAAIEPNTLELTGLVLLITLLGHVLRHVASLQRLIAVLKALLRDRRVAMAVAPAFVGLLPMPGGALFSAPMVGELSDDLEAPTEDWVVINFWFRHVWELVWPLYPGILIAASILDAPLDKLILSTAPISLAAIVIGFVFCFRRVELPPREEIGPAAAGTWRELVAAVWPVGLVVLLTVVIAGANAAARQAGLGLGLSTKAALLVALGVVVPLFMVVKGVRRADAVDLVRRTVRLRLVVLIYGLMAFGVMLREYRVAESLAGDLAAIGVPGGLLLFVVPFLVGVLMGYTPAYVAICFPLLAPFILADGAVHYGRYAFAIASGFMGVLSSPVHLCLVLSKEYFGADFGRVYRRLLPLVVLLTLTALGVMFFWEAVGLR